MPSDAAPPINQTLAEVLGSVGSQLPGLLRAASVPLSIYLPVSAVWEYHALIHDSPITWAPRLVAMGALATSAVSWHRRLLPRDCGPRDALAGIGWEDCMYFGVLLLYKLGTIALAWLVGSFAGRLIAAGAPAAAVMAVVRFAVLPALVIYLSVRLSLVLPHVAIGGRPAPGLKLSLSCTRRRFWRLFCLYAAMALPTYSLMLFVASSGLPGPRIVVILVLKFLWVLAILLGVAVATVSYRVLVMDGGEAPASSGRQDRA